MNQEAGDDKKEHWWHTDTAWGQEQAMENISAVHRALMEFLGHILILYNWKIIVKLHSVKLVYKHNGAFLKKKHKRMVFHHLLRFIDIWLPVPWVIAVILCIVYFMV